MEQADPKQVIRFMRVFSMARKIMADMIEEEAEFGLDTPSQQQSFVARHQQYNHEWWPCFRHMDIHDYTIGEMLMQLMYEMRLVVQGGDYPGVDAVVPSQRQRHAEVESNKSP